MYKEQRQQFYAGIEQFWPDLYGEEYALYDVHALTRAQVEKIRLATERAGQIFFKIAHLLRNVEDETLLDMGYPVETLAFLRLKTIEPESVIARFDFIEYNGSYKCIELNADTPTFIKELFFVNERVCRQFKRSNPNAQMEERLKRAVQESVPRDAHVVFTAHDEHIEDYYTALYLMQFVPGAKFTPLKQLQIRRGVGLFDEAGQRIDVLYRQTFPIENAVYDLDIDGNPIGVWLLELVEQQLVTIVNPPSAFLLQNKAVQAVIWGLHEERHAFFSEEEHAWIAEYFLPTYLDERVLRSKGMPYVKKPVFGREGDTVEIYDKQGHLQKADCHTSYKQYTSIYQHYIPQPKATFQSVRGEQTGELLIGSFLLNGRAGAIGLRVGGMITDNLSYYLPVGVKDEQMK
ncbi:MAG: glutathionylspermidine synthase family protein [Solibacillus sp.]